MKTDVVIVGCGVAGLFCALSLPREKQIVLLTKSSAEESDSFLAQGGICVQRDEEDYDSYFEDTMRAGHYENDPRSVEVMIRSSREVIDSLIGYGVCFEQKNGEYLYTREGAHSRPRILFHADETGKEITSKLLAQVRKLPNVTILEYYTVVDILDKDGVAKGVVGRDAEGRYSAVRAEQTVLATGGIGGLFAHSTNFPHLTGDALAIAIRHGVKLKNIDYIQIHPTTLYTKRGGRSFLISESVRGEGAFLLNHKGERFVNELLPRDVVANAIFEEMKKEGTDHIWLSLEAIPTEEILRHFPNIYQHCLEEGYDVTMEPIPVVPAQHYFMGGIAIDEFGRTSMKGLYAVGETACNGVHGRNRLASNSLLESLVFARGAARHIAADTAAVAREDSFTVDEKVYFDCEKRYKQIVLEAIEKEKNRHE